MVGFPPIESREDTLRALGRVDLFGTGVNPQQMERMRQLEVINLGVLVFNVHHACVFFYYLDIILFPEQGTKGMISTLQLEFHNLIHTHCHI